MAEEVREFLKDTYGIEEDGELPAKADISGRSQQAEKKAQKSAKKL